MRELRLLRQDFALGEVGRERGRGSGAWSTESVSNNGPVAQADAEGGRGAGGARRPSGAEEGEAACRGRCGGGSASPTGKENQSLSDSCSGSEDSAVVAHPIPCPTPSDFRCSSCPKLRKSSRRSLPLDCCRTPPLRSGRAAGHRPRRRCRTRTATGSAWGYCWRRSLERRWWRGSRTGSRRRRGGTSRQRERLAREEWLVFLPEAYPGSITWKDYEENRSKRG